MIKEPDYKNAEWLFYEGKKDSAFYYFNEVVSKPKDSLQTAMAYNYMASMQSDAGDYFGSQESLLSSLKYLDKKQEKYHECLASDYNELGVTSLNLGHYDAAIDYYDQALPFVKEEPFKLVVLNNKAVALQRKHQYSAAQRIYDSVLALLPLNTQEYARVLSNLAKTKWLKDKGYNAAPEFLEALRIRQYNKDEWGENASYAHLADYYTPSHPDSALLYSNNMYAIAQRLNSPDDQLEALQKLIKLVPATSVKAYFERYQHLNDSLQNARSAAKNQFALIRYESEKHKAENLELQQENTEKQSQIQLQRLFSFFAVVIFLFILFFIVWRSRKKKQQLELQTEKTIKEKELKTSQKVHDVVANGLYRLMTEIQYREDIDKEYLLDKIEDMYEQSRDISYEPQAIYKAFHEELGDLISAFNSDETKVFIFGNEEPLWTNISTPVRHEVKCILQELMVNMKKHSSAGNVALSFERSDDLIQIQYTDDGIGLPAEIREGNGLKNTGNRINVIGGKISFENKTTKGLKVLISFPIR